jgi:hypothetical protein
LHVAFGIPRLSSLFTAMAAETLAAIGLAGNIVGFVDFGAKLLSSAVETYQSTEGSLKENDELQAITSQLHQNFTSLSMAYASTQDPTLRDLLNKSILIAKELLDILESFKIDTKKNRRLESVRVSLRMAMKKGDIKGLEGRINRLRDGICFTTTTLLL